MIHRAIVAWIVLGLTEFAAAQEKVALRLLSPPGHYEGTGAWKDEAVRTLKQDGNVGKEVRTKTILESTADVVIAEANKDGAKRVSSTYRRFVIEVSDGKDVLKLDSADPNSGSRILADVTKPALGGTITYDLLPDGNRANIKGSDEIIAGIRQAVLDGDGNYYDLVSPLAIHLTSACAVKESRPSTWFLPKGPVALGDTWKPVHPTDANDPLSAATSTLTVYTLSSIERGAGGKAHLSYEDRARLDKPVEYPLYTADRNEIVCTGSMVIDLSTGMIVAAEQKDTFDSAGTSKPEGFKMTMKGTSERRTTTKAVKAAATGPATK